MRRTPVHNLACCCAVFVHIKITTTTIFTIVTTIIFTIVTIIITIITIVIAITIITIVIVIAIISTPFQPKPCFSIIASIAARRRLSGARAGGRNSTRRSSTADPILRRP
eukprot:s533_g4.t1